MGGTYSGVRQTFVFSRQSRKFEFFWEDWGEMNADDEEEQEHLPTLLSVQVRGVWGGARRRMDGGKDVGGMMENAWTAPLDSWLRGGAEWLLCVIC